MDSYQEKKESGSRNQVLTIIILSAGIFLAEVIAMILVVFFEGPYHLTILLDAVITTVLMIPVLYIMSYRPLLKHITERKRVEKILQVRLRLREFADTHTVDELLQATLDEIELLTKSTIAFFHFLEADQETLSLQTWSTSTLQHMCKAEGKGSHYSVDQAGVWADCIRQRQAIIHNDYASLAHRKGLPEGHAAITRELTVPILRDQKVVAILGMGNKPTDFTTDDLTLVSTMADFAWDIISHKQGENALRENELKFRTLVDWTYDWEQWVDPQGNIIYTSPSCERITGYTPEEFIADPELLVDIIHPEDLPFFMDHKQLLHDESAGVANVEYRIIARDGSEHWIDHICRPIFNRDHQYQGRRVSNREITDRKRTEEEIENRNQREKMLTQTIHTMQLEIARDLHDTVGQNISYLRMKLEHLSETNLQIQPDLKMEIHNISKVANESYDLIRGTLSVLQSGKMVDPFELFIQYGHQIQERSPFKVNVTTQGEPKTLSTNQLRQLFFVFREALSNIEKHAHASMVAVGLSWNDNCFALTIEDNGGGFREENLRSGRHYGLQFMQERIESLNGHFSITSESNRGTSIKISLPYQ